MLRRCPFVPPQSGHVARWAGFTWAARIVDLFWCDDCDRGFEEVDGARVA